MLYSRKKFRFLDPPKQPSAIKPLLRVAIVPTPEFTLGSLACFVDFLRHCADESNYSRQVYCSWTLLSHNKKRIRASCGLEIEPQGVFSKSNPADFDVVVVHGGILRSNITVPDELYEFVRQAKACEVSLAGCCTGSFVFAEMGLLDHRRCAVHFTLFDAMRRLFPKVVPVTSVPVVRDGPVMTCASGLAVIHLASLLVREHCGSSRAYKASHYMRTDRVAVKTQDSHEEEMAFIALDRRLSNAVGIMRQHMRHPYTIDALAREVGTTERNLSRLFLRYLKTSPSKYWRDIRLEMSRHLVLNTDFSMMQVADECGFTDDSHLAKRFSEKYKLSPASMRHLRNKSGVL